jgi:hypothetical protein
VSGHHQFRAGHHVARNVQPYSAHGTMGSMGDRQIRLIWTVACLL